ncbi:MAG TPA: hypothetical protein GXX39_00900 [Syntrophothermus lipocalidus]|uniref:Uncharacterized protein n=1 Tax=Syntrophothermus lipocalidus (strain DSM 12680 / TGB-C1) TaxID=643648 RepID=D7CNF6_SYNLT|nr:hypothetical protein [Syntrophothermus lipocalidus]ADI02241.1 conserved hypothetical protein [Syntrophothermus lipocalidus DSM 12680]HHV75917.1 hypothetical protein [Syntrophothermus lipocalidus]
MDLYRAWSVVDGFRGHDRVRLNWFVIGREKPVAPYEELIKDYDSDDAEIVYDHLVVKELLTLQELEELRQYITNTHNTEIFAEKVELPVRRGGLSYSLVMMSGQDDFIFLPEEAGYNLSVNILAHYDLKGCPPAANIETVEALEGLENWELRFLQLCLQELGILSFDEDALAEIAKKVSDSHGLAVVRR